MAKRGVLVCEMVPWKFLINKNKFLTVYCPIKRNQTLKVQMLHKFYRYPIRDSWGKLRGMHWVQ